jgi:serine/threonine protein kinase
VPERIEEADDLGLPSLAPKTPEPSPDDGDGEPERRRGARRGDTIGGKYKVEGQIGRGGMGRVLQVRHSSLDKAFALKLPQRRTIASREVRERFHREAKLASSLQHENICSVIDFGEDPRFGLFMVMELLEGVRLDYKLRRDGRLPTKVACDVIGQVAEALLFVHSRGIIHGDIKSENILLTRGQDRRRQAKLLDFGLARPEASTEARGDGTPAYMAPERISHRPATPQSDLYALGILFWECLVGELPFQGPYELVFQKQLHEPLPPPSSRIDRPLEQRADLIVARATAKRPEDRHPDMSSFLYELRTLGSMLGVEPGRRRDRVRVLTTPAASHSRSADPGLTAAAEVFENSPIPLASVDPRGVVRIANRAFRAFIGHVDAGGVMLSETGFVNVYPSLLDDLQLVVDDGTMIRQVIEIPDRSGLMVETAVMLTPVLDSRLVTAGDIYISLHPLAARKPG